MKNEREKKEQEITCKPGKHTIRFEKKQLQIHRRRRFEQSFSFYLSLHLVANNQTNQNGRLEKKQRKQQQQHQHG